MLTKKKTRKLSFEILAIVALCLLISILLFTLLFNVTLGVIDQYLFNNDIYLDEFEYYKIDRLVLTVGLIISIIVFIVLFIILFKEKIAYIKVITEGINQLQLGNYDNKVIIKGNNELTTLANSINYLSSREKLVKAKEHKLQEEKEELIRNLSHDIRTPLTSIISYTELLSSLSSVNKKQQKEYYELVKRKTKQIKELTDILLDGSKRNLSTFDDVTLLFKQLIEEVKEELEDTFSLDINIEDLSNVSASFDVNELIRIFDNLSSNIIKYADNTQKVYFKVHKDKDGLTIIQSNTIKKENDEIEKHNIGLNSIKKIAQNYGGSVIVNNQDNVFKITINLINI